MLLNCKSFRWVYIDHPSDHVLNISWYEDWDAKMSPLHLEEDKHAMDVKISWDSYSKQILYPNILQKITFCRFWRIHRITSPFCNNVCKTKQSTSFGTVYEAHKIQYCLGESEGGRFDLSITALRERLRTRCLDENFLRLGYYTVDGLQVF